jgi:HK97 family phage major capsid protein
MAGSHPTFREMKLEPQELYVLVYETDKLLRNAPALAGFLTKAAGEELNFKIGDAIINGTGAGQPLGILTSQSKVTVSKENEQPAATIVSENIWEMYTSMHPRSVLNASWFINLNIWPQLFKLTLDVGTSGVALFQPPTGIAGAPFGTLIGRPLVPIEYCPTLGTEGDIIFWDPGSYATGTKGGVRSDQSIHLRFDFAETAFRFETEVDGQPWLGDKLTPFKGASDSLSTHITLETRS